jgi:hypothetical protein
MDDVREVGGRDGIGEGGHQDLHGGGLRESDRGRCEGWREEEDKRWLEQRSRSPPSVPPIAA